MSQVDDGSDVVKVEANIPEGELIEGLKEDPNYFAVKYNEMKKQDASNGKVEQTEKRLEAIGEPAKPKSVLLPAPVSRAGGVYVPPHKLRQLQEEMMKNAADNQEQQQRMQWEMLRKSINEIINKVNVSNIQNVIIELLNENIMRGIGLVARSIIKSQMASPNFTHVYAALVSVVNTKLPDVAELILRRVILQFRRAYQRNNKIVCMATSKFLAHLVNQKVLSHIFGLQLMIFLLDEPTEDSVDVACEFMKECGQVLTDLMPAGVTAVFERFKGILHEGETDRKVQYSIENLFAIRKNKFKDHPGVIPELDLVDEADQITHNIDLDAELTADEELNIFRVDPFFDQTEEEWKQIKISIIGEDNILNLKAAALQTGADPEEAIEEEQPQILDFTEEDLLKLRETIYLVIMNSVTYEECAHKLMKLHIGKGHEDELSKMILDCCIQERTYLKFYGLLAQRFCDIDDIYKRHYFRLFVDNYTVIHRLPTNQIRNMSKFFAHLLLTDALDWHVLRCVTISEAATTSSSRIFLKLMFQDLAENMGIKELCKRMHDPDMKEYFVGIFPTDHPMNTRFAINFFGLIGLDPITQPLREFLSAVPEVDNEQLMRMLMADNEDSSDTSSSDSGSEESEAQPAKEAAEEKNNKKQEKTDKAPTSLNKKEEKSQKDERTRGRPRKRSSSSHVLDRKKNSRDERKKSPEKRKDHKNDKPDHKSSSKHESRVEKRRYKRSRSSSSTKKQPKEVNKRSDRKEREKHKTRDRSRSKSKDRKETKAKVKLKARRGRSRSSNSSSTSRSSSSTSRRKREQKAKEKAREEAEKKERLEREKKEKEERERKEQERLEKERQEKEREAKEKEAREKEKERQERERTRELERKKRKEEEDEKERQRKIKKEDKSKHKSRKEDEKTSKRESERREKVKLRRRRSTSSSSESVKKPVKPSKPHQTKQKSSKDVKSTKKNNSRSSSSSSSSLSSSNTSSSETSSN